MWGRPLGLLPWRVSSRMNIHITHRFSRRDVSVGINVRISPDILSRAVNDSGLESAPEYVLEYVLGL